MLKKAFLLALIGMIGCSAEKNTMVSKAYHNTTAHFNAYFIALEKMKEIEEYVQSNTENNFNHILDLYPQIDSTLSLNLKDLTEEVIKKASIAIQRHQNSKWVDDSYVLVGKARFYNLEFTDAIETFKYVNARGDDPGARHEALIFLMRTFVDYKEFNNAIAVSDYLRKEKLHRKNLKDLYLTRAYLYQRREDHDNMVRSLAQAAPLMTQAEGQARIYFVIGQVYQQLGFDAEAYNNYGLCLKNNPSYEFAFYAQLYRAQVFVLHRKTDIKRVRKYFKKLLKDPKNKEFKDKIYFEMAAFEIKQDDIEQAIELYNRSIRASINNRRQKAFSYLKLGEIYYDRKSFELAKTYYDSVIIEMPQDQENYQEIADRQAVLADFVDQLNTIHLQDSLLILSKMDSISLDEYLDEVIAERLRMEDERKRLAEEKSKKERESRDSNTFPTNFDQGYRAQPGVEWYFYNTSALALGHSEFVRRWSNRKLEDNWRRSNRGTTTEALDEASSDEPVEDAVPGKAEKKEVSVDPSVAKGALYATIPDTEAELQLALGKIEMAYYRLGNIYYFDLEEIPNAAGAFQTLLQRFEQTEYKPEVLYQLYLIYRDLDNPKAQDARMDLVQNFPKSVYARLIENPNYREESQATNTLLQKMYQQAYQLFKLEYYDSANFVLEQGVSQYPDSEFSDNLRLLQILIIGKTEDIYLYQYSLDQFIQEYQESDLSGYAKTLRQASEEYLYQRTGNKYIESFDKEHSFVIIYPRDAEISEAFFAEVNEFAQDRFSKGELVSANLILDDNYAMVLMESFYDKAEALRFYGALSSTQSPLTRIEYANFDNFVITKENFQILYQLKDFEGYLKFFAQHY